MEGQFLLSVLIVSGFMTVESSYVEVTLLPCPTGTFSKGTGCINCHAGTLYSLPCSRFSSRPKRDNSVEDDSLSNFHNYYEFKILMRLQKALLIIYQIDYMLPFVCSEISHACGK